MVMVTYLVMAPSSTKRHNTNAVAARLLLRTFRGQPLETALQRHRHSFEANQLSFLCYQAFRHYFSLTEILSSHLSRPWTSLDVEVQCVLLIGACQLKYSSIAPAAAISRSVEATKHLGKTSASGMVNAVLRKTVQSPPATSEEALHELPSWWIERLKTSFPDEATEIMRVSLLRAPLTLRINNKIISADNYCKLLTDSGIAFERTLLENSLILSSPMPMEQIPGFQEGLFSIQDLSSQLAVPLLQAEDQHRLLDACAAPGIKTRHIQDLYPKNTIISMDKKPQCSTWNIPILSNNGVKHPIITGDLESMSWWDGEFFDRVLLDVPCSGSGTLRRHPDLKVTRTKQHIANINKVQRTLLQNLWSVLSPNGKLVYCTCSLFDEENDRVVAQHIENNPDTEVDQIMLPHGKPTPYGWQVLPSEIQDGFYFSRLTKIQSA